MPYTLSLSLSLHALLSLLATVAYVPEPENAAGNGKKGKKHKSSASSSNSGRGSNSNSNSNNNGNNSGGGSDMDSGSGGGGGGGGLLHNIHGVGNHSLFSSGSDNDLSIIQPRSPQKKKRVKKLVPREKDPFAGFKPLLDDDVKGDGDSLSSTPRPSNDSTNGPHILAENESPFDMGHTNAVILERYLNEVNALSGIELELLRFPNSVAIADVSKEAREGLFLRKLRLCTAKCNFLEPVL